MDKAKIIFVIHDTLQMGNVCRQNRISSNLSIISQLNNNAYCVKRHDNQINSFHSELY